MKETIWRVLDILDHNFDKVLIAFLISLFAVLFVHAFRVKAEQSVLSGLLHTLDTLVGFLGGIVVGRAIARSGDNAKAAGATS